MDWITCLQNALKYIEDNIENKIDISSVASAAYVSPFYLQKGFRIMTGYTVGEYIRCRRLYESAMVLVNSEEKIIDIALRFGYDTPESFTKAFTRFHGTTPSAVRRDIRLVRRFLPLKIRIEITGGNKMEHTISPMFGFKLLGFERTFNTETSYTEIPKFWDEICEKYCTHTIYAGLPPANACEQAIMNNCIGEYALCRDNDDPDGKTFRYMIAGRYTGGEVPEGMTLVEIPAGMWAKFKIVGALPEAFQTMNTQIFKEWLPQNPDYELAGNYNIEWYNCDIDKDQPDYESGIWLPIKKKNQ